MVKYGATGADLSTPFLDVGLAMQHAETGVTRCPKWSNFDEVVKMLNNARNGSDVGHMVVWQRILAYNYQIRFIANIALS